MVSFVVVSIVNMRVVEYHMFVKLDNVNFMLCWLDDDGGVAKFNTKVIVVELYFVHDIVNPVVNDTQSNTVLNNTSAGKPINTLSPE